LRRPKLDTNWWYYQREFNSDPLDEEAQAEGAAGAERDEVRAKTIFGVPGNPCLHEVERLRYRNIKSAMKSATDLSRWIRSRWTIRSWAARRRALYDDDGGVKVDVVDKLIEILTLRRVIDVDVTAGGLQLAEAHG
jgi:hypothetical protein